jgi:AP2-associated kinase
VGQFEIKEEVLLAEGGYGYVWKAQDVNTQRYYAVKKMICQNEEKLQVAQNEMETMVSL